MAEFAPLIWDQTRGVSRQQESNDVLGLPGGLQVEGGVGFFGADPVADAEQIGGDWGQSIDALIFALAALGLISDERAAGWGDSLDQLVALGDVGPYEPGRLIIGSVTGWMNLDQPADEPGVIQVPAAYAGASEVPPGGGPAMRQLAYSPVLAYSATEPNGEPLAGALWFDVANDRLKVWSGSAWVSAQSAGVDGLIDGLAGLVANKLVVSDGTGGVKAMTLPGGSLGGLVPMLGSAGTATLLRLLSVGTSAPWANGSSAYAGSPGGGRPNGAHHALWFSPATQAEMLSVWDENAKLWKGVYVNNPLLNRLAELRPVVAEGDLFVYRSGQINRLPVGQTGSSLTVENGHAHWHQRFVRQTGAPSAPLEGDYWLDDDDVLWLYADGDWRDLSELTRHQDANGTGGVIALGTALVHDSSNWKLAGESSARDALVGVAISSANPGAPVSVAVGGVVTLSAAAWSAVIDSAEPHVPGAGLLEGRMYYASSLVSGKLTSLPEAGEELPVGLALSTTRLLLRPAAPLSDRPARVGVADATPSSPLDGQLWWDAANGNLQVYLADGGWTAVDGDGVEPEPVEVPNAVTAIEAIDWVEDPLTAAIRFTFADTTTETIRLRGAGGTVITMSDNRTLVIDAAGGGGGGGLTSADGGRFSPLI